jgi:hypothetical protein
MVPTSTATSSAFSCGQGNRRMQFVQVPVKLHTLGRPSTKHLFGAGMHLWYCCTEGLANLTATVCAVEQQPGKHRPAELTTAALDCPQALGDPRMLTCRAASVSSTPPGIRSGGCAAAPPASLSPAPPAPPVLPTLPGSPALAVRSMVLAFTPPAAGIAAFSGERSSATEARWGPAPTSSTCNNRSRCCACEQHMPGNTAIDACVTLTLQRHRCVWLAA